MSENSGNKKKGTSSGRPSSGKKAGKRKNPKGGGASPDANKSGVSLKKKKGLSGGRTVEISAGNQIRLEDVMKEAGEGRSEPVSKPKTPPEKKPDDDAFTAQADESEYSVNSDGSDISLQISWKKQARSIGVWMFSVILLALTFFPGENAWNWGHRIILGMLGFKAFLWAGLLIFFGYLLSKQISEDEILHIIRPTAGIILTSDVLGYILIQSDSYRNVYNERSFNWGQLFLQMFSDGEKVGGSGFLGGFFGEMFMLIAGKTGAAIITVIMMTALIMVLTRTGPMELFNKTKRVIKSLFDPGFYRRLFDGEMDVKTVFDTSDFFQEEESDDDGISVEVPGEESDLSDLPAEEAADSHPEEDSLSEIVKAVSLKKKKKKLTKAEEIKAESDAFSKQVNEGDGSPEEPDEKEYKYPTVRLLIPSKNVNSANDIQELTETAEKLIRTLEEYGVKASISDISRGPTVTRYEIKPAPGVKINKITNLSNDIALRLAAQSIRIEAPIPGKAAVGIEIPNQNKQMVRIREIIGSTEFAEAKGSLTVALGKDIEGNIVLCDLSKMPHLLIAGSTGSGKSVCVNSMLISLLYKYSPDEVRMVLIDPKSVEFDMYNGIPHLLVPVVCEPKKAAGALQWAVSEMLKRYTMLKERGVRNIDGYNRLAAQSGEFGKLCRIVIVIDEMADLMIASPKEVEDAIARLAAMARAAGMYMVLATQRPSVDVITGTIKNNIPSRIALAVSSQVDSRTILDEGGAENLIGYGDMLYHPMGSSKHIRVQGCFVDDDEVERVIRFVKQNGLAEYDDSIADEIERNSLDGSGDGSAEFEGKDEFFEKAVEVVTEAGQASTSMLQRRLGVGYARAGRIIDQLEEHGIIGPHEGSKPRAVLITRTQWLEMTMARTHAGKNDPLLRNNSEFAAQTLDAGHEEISARQSEFFNAENDGFNDGFYEEEDDYTDDEMTAAPDDPDEEPSGEASEEEEADEPSDAETDDGVIDVEFESEEPQKEEKPAHEVRDIAAYLREKKAARAKALEAERQESGEGAVSHSQPQKPPRQTASTSSDTSKANRPAKDSSSTRDFSVFFDDEPEQIDDFFDFSGGRKTSRAQPDDVPPWEELPTQTFSEIATEFGGDLRVSSDTTEDGQWEEEAVPPVSEILPGYRAEARPAPEPVPPRDEPDNAPSGEDDDLHSFFEPDTTPAPKRKKDKPATNHNSYDDDDDDLFDDVMSSPWIKKL